jgi:hypothetical protein
MASFLRTGAQLRRKNDRQVGASHRNVRDAAPPKIHHMTAPIRSSSEYSCHSVRGPLIDVSAVRQRHVRLLGLLQRGPQQIECREE